MKNYLIKLFAYIAFILLFFDANANANILDTNNTVKKNITLKTHSHGSEAINNMLLDSKNIYSPKSSTTITISDVTGDTGNSIIVPVNTSGITDLANFQWTIKYDDTKLTYVSCTNWNTISGVLINSSTSGELKFVFAEATGVNIAAGVFFDLNFDIKVGASGVANLLWSDDPTPREVGDGSSNPIITTWVDGSVTINASTNPTLTITEVNGVAGSAVVVPVNAKDISDLVGFQFTIDYDETKLTYTGTSNWDAGVTGTPTINDDGDVLTFAYNDYPNAINIADGKFFDLNFTVLGGASGVAPVIWSDSPTVRELSNSVPEEITGTTWVDGKVTITAPANPILTIEDVNGVAGSPVTVPVDAFNLNDLVGFQFTIDYDETKLTYTGTSNWDAGVTGTPTINDDGNVLTFAYNDYPNAINIADGKFFDLNFTVLGGASGIAPVIWSDTPTVRELSDSAPAEIIGSWVDGSVTITANTVWDGSTSTDWQDITNWTPENIPEIGTNITIPDGCPNYPIIDDGTTTAICNDMIIEANSNIIIATNGQMTVAGTITNSAGVNGITIKSDATGDGSLIMNNTGVNGTVERYLSKTIGETGQWHFIGSPITTAPVSLFNTANFYEYDESTDDWWTGATYFGTSGWSVPSGNLTVGKAYTYYYYETTISYGGEINYNTSYPSTVTYTNHGAGNAANGEAYSNFDGWKMVSNPYPCALDWTQMNLTDINNTLYFYDDLTSQYKYFNGTGGTQTDIGITVNGGSQHIPSGQGFFVKTDNTAGGTFEIPNTARVHNSQAFWKKKTYETPNNFIRFKVENSISSDETVLRTLDNSHATFDSEFDAYKRYSWNINIPQIFTTGVDYSTLYAINTTNIDESPIVPLGYYFSEDGEHTLLITEIKFANYDVYLVDKQTGKEVNLKEKQSYTFTSNSGIIKDRLEIRFEKIVGTDNLSLNKIRLYPNPANEIITIIGLDSIDYSSLNIYSISGKLIKSLKANSINEINISNLKKGLYFIEINNINGKIIDKFVKE